MIVYATNTVLRWLAQRVRLRDSKFHLYFSHCRSLAVVAKFIFFIVLWWAVRSVDLRIAMVFVLDNYDSFTYNLVQYMGELGAEMVILRMMS